MKNIEKIQKHKYLNGSVVQGKKSTELYIYIYIYISVGHERKKRIMRVFLQFVKLRKNYKLRGGMRDFVSVNT